MIMGSGDKSRDAQRSMWMRWNNLLSTLATSIGPIIFHNPVHTILIPCAIILIFAYPAMYSFYLSPHGLTDSTLWDFSKYLKHVTIESSVQESQYVYRSFSLHCDTNLLSSEFLYQFSETQSTLLTNLEQQIDNNEVVVYSPLDYWNRDIDELLNDVSIMKTVQINGPKLNRFHGQPLNNVKLFSDVRILNGITRAAHSLNIIIYYKMNAAIDNLLNVNISKLNEKFPNISIVRDSPETFDTIKISYKFASWSDLLRVYLVGPVILLLCPLLRMKDLKVKCAILLAMLFQFCLSGLASLTITSIFFDSKEFSSLPLPIFVLVPLVVVCENISRFLIELSKNSYELSNAVKITKTIVTAFPKSTNFNIFAIILSMINIYVSKTPSTLYFAVFTILFIAFNYFLTHTYILTILIIDLNRRVELQDLMSNGKDKKKIFSLLATRYTYLYSVLLIIINIFIFQWIEGITTSFKLKSNFTLNMFLNKRGFVYDLIKSDKILSDNENSTNKLLIKVFNPLDFSVDNSPIGDGLSASKFNMFYLFEFISFLVFVASTIVFVLKISNFNDKLINFKNNKNTALIPSESKSSFFHSKDLIKGHVLDIVKLCTSSCPFIVSVGIDHKILVWSPLKQEIPAPTQLPISNKFLPISHVVMSDSGSLICVFSKTGEIKCWSRLAMTWIWAISFDELNNDVPLESFFRRKTIVNNGRRKLVSRTLKKEKPSRTDDVLGKPDDDEKNVKTKTPTRTLKTRTGRLSKLTPNALRPKRSLSIDSNFDETVNLNQLSYNSEMEFIIVLKNGAIISINCMDGKFERSVLSNSLILCSKKLLSPRVNDRIVGIKEDGELVVSTCINNRWVSRPVKIDANNYNMGKSLITPAVLSTYSEITLNSYPIQNNDNYNDTVNNKQMISSDNFSGIFMEAVPFVGMIVRAYSSKCQLIDVQTGTVLKEWKIGKFVPNSFQVFHPEPSHCKFCGCASVESFSVSYNEINTEFLILHTFSIDNRAKNNICLRVERDSRETRCLGFASVNEHRYWLSGVEGWSSTDLNTLMGIRRKDSNNESGGNIDQDDDMIERIFNSNSLNDVTTLRRRKNTQQNMMKTSSSKQHLTGSTNSSPRLSDIWEGWTMHADGEIKFYEIPDDTGSGLLIKKLGPVQKFGHKSMAVTFGNIMKVLYLGNDNLIEGDDDDHENGNNMIGANRIRASRMTNHSIISDKKLGSLGSSKIQEDDNEDDNDNNEHIDMTSTKKNELSFIDGRARRKLKMEKYNLTHSTNFGDICK